MVSEAMRFSAFSVGKITVNMSKRAATLGWTKKIVYLVVAILVNDRDYDNVIHMELSGIVSPVGHRECDIFETYPMHNTTTNN
jgi:hypothetical protein